MADPDLQITWGAEGGGGGVGGDPDPEIRGGPGLPHFSFRPFGPSGRKNVMSIRELFCPDPLPGLKKWRDFKYFLASK